MNPTCTLLFDGQMRSEMKINMSRLVRVKSKRDATNI